MKEYRDPSDGRTYQFEEGQQPDGYELVEAYTPKHARKPANKAAEKPADK